tara:strand:+ start:3137 stop:3616 length:480 start_codon:yes stop_codon:yes gene_type:complete
MALDPKKLAEAAAHTGDVDPDKAAEAMELANEMSALKGRIKVGKDLISELNERYNSIRFNLLPEAMNAAGMVSAAGKASLSLADGKKVHLQSDLHAGIAAADREMVFAWFQDNGFGDLIKPTVHASTLTAFVKEQLSLGEQLPEGIKASPFLKAVLRKA